MIGRVEPLFSAMVLRKAKSLKKPSDRKGKAKPRMPIAIKTKPVRMYILLDFLICFFFVISQLIYKLNICESYKSVIYPIPQPIFSHRFLKIRIWGDIVGKGLVGDGIIKLLL